MSYGQNSERLPVLTPSLVATNLAINKKIPLREFAKNSRIKDINLLPIAWNLEELSPLFASPFTFTTSFQADSALIGSERITLDLGFINAAGKIFMNGKELADLANPFHSNELDVTDHTKLGDNEIKVILEPQINNSLLPGQEPLPYLPQLSPIGFLSTPHIIAQQGPEILEAGPQFSNEKLEFVFHTNSSHSRLIEFSLRIEEYASPIFGIDTSFEIAQGITRRSFPLPQQLLSDWTINGQGFGLQYDIIYSYSVDSIPVLADTIPFGLNRYEVNGKLIEHPSLPNAPLRMTEWKGARFDPFTLNQNAYFDRLFQLKENSFNAVLVDSTILFERDIFYEYASKYGLLVIHEIPSSLLKNADTTWTDFFRRLKQYPCFQGITFESATKVAKDLQVEVPRRNTSLPNHWSFFNEEHQLPLETILPDSIASQRNAYRTQIASIEALLSEIAAGNYPIVPITYPYPSTFSALEEFDSKPTALMRAFKRINQAYFATCFYDSVNNSANLSVINNSGNGVERVKVAISSFPTNSSRAATTIYDNVLTLGPGRTSVFSFPFNSKLSSFNTAFLVSLKSLQDSLLLELPLFAAPGSALDVVADPPIVVRLENQGLKSFLTLESSVLVKDLYISHGEEFYYYQDNFFDLLPGIPKTLEFFVEEPYRVPALKDSLQMRYLNPTML